MHAATRDVNTTPGDASTPPTPLHNVNAALDLDKVAAGAASACTVERNAAASAVSEPATLRTRLRTACARSARNRADTKPVAGAAAGFGCVG